MSDFSGHSVRTELVALYLIEALLCFAAFYAILSAGLPETAPPDRFGLLVLAGALALASGLAAGAVGLYQPETWLRAGRILVGTALVGLLLLLGLGFVAPQTLGTAPTAWGPAAALVVAFLVAMLGTRTGFTLLARKGLLRRPLVLVSGPGAPRLRAALRHDPVFRIAAETPLGTLAGEASLFGRGRARDLVVDDPAGLPPAVAASLRVAGVRIWATADFLERRLGRVDLATLEDNWLEGAAAARTGLLEAALRRAADVALAGLLLVATLPLSLLAALAIKLDSPGPVFYRQSRVGLRGRPFTLYKFRSMQVAAEAPGGAVWAKHNDPRVTRVGRVLRKLRIDEIPQVFNVLRGDMAFIGPRPERPEFVAQLAAAIPHYAARHAVRPGITGWAQVNYPYGASIEDAERKLTYDLYYVRRRSLFLDLIILIATVRVVLFQEGAR